MEKDKSQRRHEAFVRASTPMVEFLRRYADPHSTVIITNDHAELYSGELGVPFPYPEWDPSPDFCNPKHGKVIDVMKE